MTETMHMMADHDDVVTMKMLMITILMAILTKEVPKPN